MLNLGDVDLFLAGKLGNAMLFSYASSKMTCSVRRHEDGTATALIPASRGGYDGDQFDIEKALAHPACGIGFALDGNEYKAKVANRQQMYAVLKMARNHFGWHDDERIAVRYQGGAKPT